MLTLNYYRKGKGVLRDPSREPAVRSCPHRRDILTDQLLADDDDRYRRASTPRVHTSAHRKRSSRLSRRRLEPLQPRRSFQPPQRPRSRVHLHLGILPRRPRTATAEQLSPGTTDSQEVLGAVPEERRGTRLEQEVDLEAQRLQERELAVHVAPRFLRFPTCRGEGCEQ